MLSTYGPGAPPGCAAKFVSWLGKREETGVLRDKPYAGAWQLHSLDTWCA